MSSESIAIKAADVKESLLLFAGVIVALLSYCVGAFGIGTQRLSHIRENQRPRSLQRPYLRRPLWWLGLLLAAIGSGLTLVAMMLAPGTVVTAVSGVSLIFATIVSRVLPTGEPAYTPWVPVIIIVIGSGLGVIGPKASEVLTADTLGNLLLRPGILAFIIVQFVLLVIIFTWGKINVVKARRTAEESSGPAVEAAEPQAAVIEEFPVQAPETHKTEMDDSGVPVNTLVDLGVGPEPRASPSDSASPASPVCPSSFGQPHAGFCLAEYMPRSRAALVRLALCAASGMAGGLSVGISKAWSGLVAAESDRPAGDLITWTGLGITVALIGSVIGQVALQNEALTVTRTADFYAAFHVVWKLFGLLNTGIWFNEFYGMEIWEWICFVTGNVMGVIGVIWGEYSKAAHASRIADQSKSAIIDMEDVDLMKTVSPSPPVYAKTGEESRALELVAEA